MNVLLAAASFSSQLSGIQRHAFNLARSLLTRIEVSDVHLVVAPWQRDLVRHSGLEDNPRLQLHIAEMKPNVVSRNFWFYRGLPKLAARLVTDVVHLTYPVPLKARAFACPIVVTLHDLYPYEIPSNFGFPKAIFNRIILQRCLGEVDSIACVSDITRLRLKQYAADRICNKALRIYNCVETPSQCAVQGPLQSWSGEPFVLCVAQHRRNKNIPFLLRVFRRMMRERGIDGAMRLVIIGIAGPETRCIRRMIVELGLSKQVTLLAGLSEAELQWCYRYCEALLAPSTVEGFGLPVVEGLLAGCRVVCSDIPAFRELGEDACRYVPLGGNDAEGAFAHAILAALQEPHREPILLSILSADVIAEQYVRLYRKLLTVQKATQGVVLAGSLPSAVSEREIL